MNDIAPLAAPVDGLARAFRAARRRRLRSLGLTSGASAGVLVVLMLVAGTGGRVTLVQQPSPVTPAVGVSPHPTPSSSAHATPQATAGSGTGGSSQTGHDNAAGPAGTPAPQGRAVPGTQQRGYVSGPMVHNDTGVPVPDPQCNLDAEGNANGSTLCPSVIVRTAGSDYSFYADLCSTSPTPVGLHYRTTQELDLVVYQGTRAVWRWSHTHPPRPWVHVLRLDPGRCRGWNNLWPGVDDRGQRLPRGSYRLVAEYAAAEATDHPTWETTFSVS